jgi:hypothetical protein
MVGFVKCKCANIQNQICFIAAFKLSSSYLASNCVKCYLIYSQGNCGVDAVQWLEAMLQDDSPCERELILSQSVAR